MTTLYFSLTQNGAPLVGAAPVFLVYRTINGVDRTPPAISAPGGNNLYAFDVSDDDERLTTVFAISTNGADVGILVGAASRFDRPCAVFSVLDAYGVPWTGAAPTLADVEYLDGSPWSAPALVEMESAWLYALQPSQADALLGVQARVVPPTASGMGSATLVFRTTPSPAAISYPADAVAQMLAGTIALPNPPGGADVVLTYASNGNLLVGPVRPIEALMETLAVFVLQSGGPPPMPYMGTSAESWHETRVQVSVRGPLKLFQRGEALARALHTRAHLNTPPGYTFCLAVEADPVFLGIDEDGLGRHVFNLRVGHRR